MKTIFRNNNRYRDENIKNNFHIKNSIIHIDKKAIGGQTMLPPLSLSENPLLRDSSGQESYHRLEPYYSQNFREFPKTLEEWKSLTY